MDCAVAPSHHWPEEMKLIYFTSPRFLMSEYSSQHRDYLQVLQKNPQDNSIKQHYRTWLQEKVGESGRGELIDIQAVDHETEHDRRLHEAIHYRRIAELGAKERDHIRKTLKISLDRAVYTGGFLTEAQIPLRDFTSHADILFRYAPLLQHVDFGMELRRADFYSLAACPQLEHLRGITFSNCQRALSAPQNAGLDSLRILSESEHLSSLKKFMVWRSELSAEGAALLATTPAFQELESLHLITTNIGDAGLRALCDTRFACLQTLSIERDSITAKGLSVLQSAPFIPDLRRLNLSYNTFDQPAIDQLCTLPLHSLEHLRIDCLTCTPTGLRQILQSPLAQHLQDLVLLKKPGCPDFYDIQDVLPSHLLPLLEPAENRIHYTEPDSVPESSLSTTFDASKPPVSVNSPSPYQSIFRKRKRYTQKPQEFKDEILLEADDPFFGS